MADMPYITTEEVADLLGLTPQDVYETRRRGAFPGVLGRRRGKRLMFDQAKVESGDPGTQTTGDIEEAILWTLQGIEAKLAKAVQLAEGFIVQYNLTPIDPYTTTEETSP